jgi:transcriptional regulator with PAS, ATPase and Fis domain
LFQNEKVKHLPLAPCDEPFQLTRLCKTCRHTEVIDGTRRCSRVVAESPRVRAVLARAAVVASTDSSVLITGETGSGKEVLAKLIHSNSRRAAAPFVAVNVAALPPDLMESELFGHVKGSFTGAVGTTPGLFGEADGGTLFLDEIGEMPPLLQAKLLRVLEDREVRRVGETRPRRVDVRVLSATHRDVPALVREGRFRADLYYRIKVFELAMPPLRERRRDILPLCRAVASRLGAERFELTQGARSTLERYAWPGNVRELVNAIEHAVAFARGGPVDDVHLPDELRSARPATPVLRSLAEVERDHIRRVLDACDGNQVAASKVLGIGRSTLWRKLQARPLL